MQTNTDEKLNRPAKLTIILGTNGTGKTTILKRIIKASNDNRVLIITPDDAEWTEYPENNLQEKNDFLFTGVMRHIFDGSKFGTLQKLEYLKKCTIIFDDCRAYLKSSTSEEIHKLIIRRRQRESDIFAVGHGFTEVPPKFFTFASDLFLFRTTDNIARRKDCLKDFDRMKEAQERVNKKANSVNPHYFEYIKFS